MGWKWRKIVNLGGGFRADMSRSGIGWSWGIPGLRIGKSPYGVTWISIGIPGTGLYFTKRLGRAKYPSQEERPHEEDRPPDASDSKKIKRWQRCTWGTLCPGLPSNLCHYHPPCSNRATALAMLEGTSGRP